MATGQSQPGHGITVNAAGTSRVAATSARVTLQLASTDNKADLDGARLQPLVAALVKLGVPESSIQLPPAMGAGAASRFASLSFVVTAPTVELMRSGITSLGSTVNGMNGVALTGAQVLLRAADCGAQFGAARAQALASARRKAEAVASDLHVRIGDVLAVQAYDGSPLDGSCTMQYFVGQQGPQFNQNLDSGSDDDYVTIVVSSTVTITYAIK